ncbi:hypothetical protein GGS24DRAFT_505871 [Hypoxylon argillaceum]|nr:hypothetical protein GGS24DRAFT_505871 [Hypoxylon argillaceum]KAI1145464.1 hypothetical protein F4825DRAFT_457481 [Nemania diffusa]
MPRRVPGNISAGSSPSVLLPPPIEHAANAPQHNEHSGENGREYSAPYDDEAAHDGEDGGDEDEGPIRPAESGFADAQDDGSELTRLGKYYSTYLPPFRARLVLAVSLILFLLIFIVTTIWVLAELVGSRTTVT